MTTTPTTSSHVPTMPAVVVHGREIRIRRGYSTSVVGYADLIDADRFAAEIRGAIADAYCVGTTDGSAIAS